MRLVLDTNVLIAAFISRGVCAEPLEHVALRHEPITSRFILNEFQRILLRKFAIPTSDASAAARLLSSQFTIIEPAPLGARVCRDPDDDFVLATAVTAHCSCLITGDKDLLSLKSFRGVDILTPQQFWKFEAESAE